MSDKNSNNGKLVLVPVIATTTVRVGIKAEIGPMDLESTTTAIMSS